MEQGCVFIYLSVCLSVDPYVRLSVYLSVRPSIRLSVYSYLSVRPPVRLYVSVCETTKIMTLLCGVISGDMDVFHLLLLDHLNMSVCVKFIATNGRTGVRAYERMGVWAYGRVPVHACERANVCFRACACERTRVRMCVRDKRGKVWGGAGQTGRAAPKAGPVGPPPAGAGRRRSA